MNVGETPAQAVIRETLEETGILTRPVALAGVYDSRLSGIDPGFQVYKFTFLCQPGEPPSDAQQHHSQETLETGWFAEDSLPEEIHSDHLTRIRHAFRVWRGDVKAFFDL